MPRGIRTSLEALGAGPMGVDIKCHEGFRCVSAVDVFGRGHDGIYKGYQTGVVTPPRFRGAYEEGCPARGEITPAHDCRDFGKGPVSYCWSQNRYEVGPESPCKDPTYCMCIKNADNGTGTQSAKASLSKQEVTSKAGEVVQGQELQTRKYFVQDAEKAECVTCAAHNCSRENCNKCGNCEFGTKTIVGRTAKGCFDRDFGESRRERQDSKEGRKYLYEGMEGREGEAKEQSLLVIPHYKLWDPGDKRMNGEEGGETNHAAQILKYPYESRREPLSREQWINDYKKAAPRIQATVDDMAALIKKWGPDANDLDCTQDIAGWLSKANMYRRECKKHQEIIFSLAPRSPFKDVIPDPDPAKEGAFVTVKCQRGGQGMCENLNCYSDDDDFVKGIAQLNERARTCRKALGLLVKEEENNGPIAEEAEVTAKAGGRLEVALPPPGTRYKEGQSETAGAAMPVEIGLALLTSAGALSAAHRNFFPTAYKKVRSSHPGVAHEGKRHAWDPEVLSSFLCLHDAKEEQTRGVPWFLWE